MQRICPPCLTCLTCLMLMMLATGCGNGIPVQLRIDTFTTAIDVESTIEKVEAGLKSKGLLPPSSTGIPEVWPDTLPHVTYQQDLTSAPQVIDLSSDQNQYKQLFQYKSALDRVEVNDLVVRLEQNSSNVPLPETTLQAAEGLNPNPDNPRIWVTIGNLPAAEVKNDSGPVTDLDFQYVPGGESFIDDQLSNPGNIQFALRTRGVFNYDSQLMPYRPHGIVAVRVIVILTIFVSPERL